eukprot:Amastigsp_a678043_19.p2 type:complete len:116 gc:universal Amastigsp_a678043_19:70-417(+)
MWRTRGAIAPLVLQIARGSARKPLSQPLSQTPAPVPETNKQVLLAKLRNRMAAERTALSYARTSLGCVGFAIASTRLLEAPSNHYVAASSVALGAVFAIRGLYVYRKYVRLEQEI